MARLYYFTFHDNTDSPSVGQSFLVDDVINPDSICVETSGTASSCLIKFQAQVVPGGNWQDVAGLRANDFFLSTNTTVLNEFWMFDINSFRQFRVNIINVSGGSITVKSKISKII